VVEEPNHTTARKPGPQKIIQYYPALGHDFLNIKKPTLKLKFIPGKEATEMGKILIPAKEALLSHIS
jgi:hypothetical protein